MLFKIIMCPYSAYLLLKCNSVGNGKLIWVVGPFSEKVALVLLPLVSYSLQ
jgi:hypothetical protein